MTLKTVSSTIETVLMSRPTTVSGAASSDDNVFVVEVTDPKDDLR